MWKYSMCLLFSCPKDNNKYQRSLFHTVIYPTPLLIIYRKSGKDGWRCISGRCKCNARCRAGVRADVCNKADIWKRVRTTGVSCRPFVSCGEGDPQTMYQLTQEFIEEYLGDRYKALFAVHVDKGHLHSHIIFNSVSMIDGYKYQYTKGDWKNIIQPITKRPCEKYGWSVIPAEYTKNSERMSRGEYEYQKSLKEVMLSDVEYCMSNAGNFED